MYYNADLFDIQQNNKISMDFINDIVFGVQEKSDTENIGKLGSILKKAEKWEARHGVRFEPIKYVLVHFIRNCRQATKAPIEIGNTTIKPAKEVKYLRVIFDQELQFKSYL